MRMLLRSLVLFGIIAAVVAVAGSPSAPAQQKDKKDEKKDDKKDDKKDKDEVGTIEVFQRKDGWRYRIKSAEGKSLAGGYIPHEKKEDCLKEVEFLKATFAKGKVVEIKDDKK